MGKGNKEHRQMIRTMDEAIAFVKQLKEEKRLIRQGAHEWKKRAVAAEKRCRELLTERVKDQDAHDETMRILAGELSETDKKLLQTMDDLQQVSFNREEIRYELVRVKAHAYDLAFGNRLSGEEC